MRATGLEVTGAHSATADDLTQETFVKVSRALAKGTMPEHFRGWLRQIARNTTIRLRGPQRVRGAPRSASAILEFLDKGGGLE